MQPFPFTFLSGTTGGGGGGTSIISSIQPFSITISSGNTSNTATISSVTTGRSVIFYGGYTTDYISSSNIDYPVRLELTNSTTVTATRGGTNNDVTVYGTVVEFTAAAVDSVQHGTVTISGGNTSGTSTISSVTTSRSVAFFLGNSVDVASSLPRYCFPIIDLTDATTVTATRESSHSTMNLVAGYTVVEFASGILNSVQQRSVNTTSASDIISDTVSSVNTSRSIIIPGGSTGSSSTIESWRFQLQLTSATNVDATRLVTNSSNRTFNYTLVEFAAGILNSLQRGTATVADASTTADTTISSVTTSKTVCNFTGFTSNGDNPAEQAGYTLLLDATHVRSGKADGDTGDDVDTSFEVVEFV